MLPVSYIGSTVEKLMFPIMSRLQNNDNQLRSVYLKGCSLLCIVLSPISAIMFVNSEDIVISLLGPQWGDTVVPLQILVTGVVFRTTYKMGDSLAKAVGAVYTRSLREAVYFFCILFGVYFGIQYGLKGAASAVLAAIIIVSLAAYVAVAQLNEETKIKVACVGDSITSDTNYPKDLSGLLGSIYDVKNFGVGRTTVSLEFEKPYYTQPEAQLARSFNPDIVVIMLGTNDARESLYEGIINFTRYYEWMLNRTQRWNSTEQIFLVLPPPIFDNSIELNGTFYSQEVVPRIQQVAQETGLPLIDRWQG